MNVITSAPVIDERHSNLSDDSKKGLGALGLAAITAGGAAVAAKAGQPKTGLKGDVKAVCGRKPLLGADKKKKWAACAQKFAPQQVPTQNVGGGGNAPSTGMSTNMKTGLIIVSVLAVVGGIIYFVKRKK